MIISIMLLYCVYTQSSKGVPDFLLKTSEVYSKFYAEWLYKIGVLKLAFLVFSIKTVDRTIPRELVIHTFRS